MVPDAPTLELLRSRLADLEARQRATGGAAERGFWETLPGRMPSGASEPDAPSPSGWPSARRRVKAARKAPEVRVGSGPQGAWAGWSPEQLESVDLLDMRWLDTAGYERMTRDPAWIESIEDYIEARADARTEDGAPMAASCPAAEVICIEASLGIGLGSHGEADLTEAAERIAHERRALEVSLVTVVSELESRGVQAPGGLSRVDWLRAHDPSLTAGQAKTFVTVGAAFAQARWARLRMLVATQQVTVANAAQVIDLDTRLRPVADPDDLATALTDLTEQAAVLRPEELARLARHHTEHVRPPRDEDRLDRGRRAARGLWFSPPNATGMIGVRGTLDPEGAAVLKAAIDPLSAPRPEKDEHGRTTAPDERTPARRRMEALLEIVQRGVAAASGVPVTDKAKVVVLIDYDALVDDVNGSGATVTGEVLSPGVVRRVACEAEIIPMVLGRDSAPLDVGRGQRLFTQSQRLALIARDQGCSYPGCTVPATWCDAHHVRPWHRGGTTDLKNAALLCPRHHTHVHEHDLTASVTATGVTWHT